MMIFLAAMWLWALICAAVYGRCIYGELDRLDDQPEREKQLLAQVEADWRESFTGTIDEFKARDEA